MNYPSFCRKNSKSESSLSNDQLEELKSVRPVKRKSNVLAVSCLFLEVSYRKGNSMYIHVQQVIHFCCRKRPWESIPGNCNYLHVIYHNYYRSIETKCPQLVVHLCTASRYWHGNKVIDWLIDWGWLTFVHSFKLVFRVCNRGPQVKMLLTCTYFWIGYFLIQELLAEFRQELDAAKREIIEGKNAFMEKWKEILSGYPNS